MNAEVHSLAGAYALNALPPDEEAFFEQHLAVCDACRAEVDELLQTAARLGVGTAAAPPPGLRANVLAAAARTRQLPPERTVVTARAPSAWQQLRGRLLAPVAACLALVVVALSGVVLNLTSRTDPPASAEVASGPVIDVLGAQDLQTVELDLGAAVPGRFLYSPSLDSGVLVAHGIADPGARETYELWLIHDGKPVPAGLFRPGREGAAVAKVSAPVRGAELVAITIEPRGGSARPTGAILASAPLET